MNWFSKIHVLAGQEYERYLPSAFDGSLTLLEKVNKVIETLNQIVLGVNTVADYVDGHVDTQNEKIKQLRDDFEVLKDWLENEGLEERTEQVLNEWFDNGRLGQIINNNVFNMKADKATFEQFVVSTTTQLQQTENEVAQKIDKFGSMQVNYANLAQDVRTMLTADNVAVVGVESTGQINLTPNAVTVYEAGFIQKGKNLLDEHNFVRDYVIDRSTGGVTPSNGLSATKNWIRVQPGETLHKNFVGNYVWADESHSPFGGGNASAPAGALVVPQNAYFIKFSLPTSQLGSAQLEYGNAETSYEKGTVQMQKGISMDGESINDESIPTKKLTGFVQSKNLLNPRRIVKEHYVASASGLLVASEYNDAFTNIYIPKGTTELRVHDFTSGVAACAFKTESGVYISGERIEPTDSKVITVPTGANTIDISFVATEIPNAMLSTGSSEQEYEEYYRYLVDLKEPHSSDEKEVGSRLTGKNVVFFGDSLTGMYADHVAYPNRVKEILGLENAYNVGFSGTRMSDTSTVQYKDFSLTNLVDSIISNNYTVQENSVGDGSTMYAPHLETLKGIDWTNVDVVSIFYGANDYSGRVPLDNESDPYDKNTFMGACRYAVKLLTETYPHLKFILATPSYRYDTDGVENNIGLLTEDYVQAIHDLQKDLKIPVIDVFHDGQINQYNHATYFQPDGLHFLQSTGLARIADLFASQMESYL